MKKKNNSIKHRIKLDDDEILLTLRDGSKVAVAAIGEGAFSAAFLCPDGKTVYIRTDKQDKCKDVLCQLKNKHIPECKKVSTGRYVNWYTMPFYDGLTRKHKKANKQMSILRRIDRVLDRYNEDKGYAKLFCARVVKAHGLPKSLKTAFRMISRKMKHLKNHRFDIRDDNFLVDKKGNLIMIDPIFNNS